MKMIQTVRGTSDLLPEDKAAHDHVIQNAAQIASQFGYQGVATPIFEFSEVFSRPLGAASDVVSKETYNFTDRGGAELTLRPEGTAAVMRAVLSNGLTQSLPLRWFYAGPMFRYERPQKGRMRQFHQIGCELIGPDTALADAEIIACGAKILDGLGVLKHTKLHINTLGDEESRKPYRTALVNYLEGHKPKLSEDSQRRLAANPLRILDSKDEGDRHYLVNAPRLQDYLTPPAKAHFEAVGAALDAAGIIWHHDPLLVRGLDYYCHTAFEFITEELGAQGTVLGGGRYDKLSEMLGGPPLAATGFAAGIERLAMLAIEAVSQPPPIGFICADTACETKAFGFAYDLRAADLPITMILSGTMKKKMKQADKLGCQFVIIADMDHFTKNKITLRNMKTGEQHVFNTDQLINWLNGEQVNES